MKTKGGRSGAPAQRQTLESFNSKRRDERLDGEIFYSLAEAQVLIEARRRHYNGARTTRWATTTPCTARSPSAYEP